MLSVEYFYLTRYLTVILDEGVGGYCERRRNEGLMCSRLYALVWTTLEYMEVLGIRNTSRFVLNFLFFFSIEVNIHDEPLEFDGGLREIC